MEKSFLAAKNLLEAANDILFTTHERTDGDDYGTVSALAQHYAAQGKRVTIAITGGIPSQLEYLPFTEKVVEVPPSSNYDLLVISGCSVLKRVNNPAIEALEIPTINFDHHPDNQNYATVNVVEPTKSSVAELMYDFFKYNDWAITHGIAQSLLTGIITDTGLLRHSNTQASTLDATAYLMQKGASISQIAKQAFEKASVQNLHAWAKALENSYFNSETKVIYSVITQEQLAELGHPELSVFEGVVETLNKVPEAKYALFLKEDNGRIKGSLRGDPHKGVDVKEIAHAMGGGGHKWAAGFTVYGKLEKAQDGRWEVV